MPDFAAPIARLIDELKHLPGIGQKTAQRLAFHLLRAKPEEALALADAIREAKQNIRECSVCNNITDTDPCLYCTGPHAQSQNDLRRGRAAQHHGHRKHAPIQRPISRSRRIALPAARRRPRTTASQKPDRTPEGRHGEEIIIATNPTAEGEATAVYVSKLLKPLGVRVTRIGVGIPVGADLEYADEVTMMKAMEGRRDL